MRVFELNCHGSDVEFVSARATLFVTQSRRLYAC